MTNTERYLSTLSEPARWIARNARAAGCEAVRVAHLTVFAIYKAEARRSCGIATAAAHHALSLPPHVLSALAAAVRADQRAWRPLRLAAP